MKEKSSINYLVANEKIRDLVFEEWEKTNILLQQGPEIIKQYFCKLWSEAKLELLYTDDIDIIDINKEIKPEDFEISYSILSNKIKAFNFIMPKPITETGQVVCVTIILTKKIPRFFILGLTNKLKGQELYTIGEWKIDFEQNDYIYNKHEETNSPNIGKFLGKISKIVA